MPSPTAGIGDLERSIARLCASSLGSFGRDGSSVVLYEDAAKRKLAGFLAALKGLSKLEVSLMYWSLWPGMYKNIPYCQALNNTA